MFRSLVPPLTLWAATCALSGAWAAAVSQGETPSTPLCVDTGQARIPRLCANVVLRYKIDALMDVPLSSYGLSWTPTSWTVTLPDGSAKPLTPDRLPASVAKALSTVTLQLRGTALADFSANSPLQFLQYQTQAVTSQNRTAWTGAARAPMDKWLFSPGQCPDGPHQTLDPLKAMALYKLGVKSLSIDPRASASLCKTGTLVSQLDGAVRALERYCQIENGRPGVPSMAAISLCLAPTAAGIPDQTAEAHTTLIRWAALLDDGAPPQITRPTMALLDAAPSPTQGSAPIQTASSTHHQPD